MELIPNKLYNLQYSGQFCHVKHTNKDLSTNSEYFITPKQGIFIGTITVVIKHSKQINKRNIFYIPSNSGAYVMYGVTNPSEYCFEIVEENVESAIKSLPASDILTKIEELTNELKRRKIC